MNLTSKVALVTGASCGPGEAMAKVLALLCSARRKGYAASLLSKAADGAKAASDETNVGALHLPIASLGPVPAALTASGT